VAQAKPRYKQCTTVHFGVTSCASNFDTMFKVGLLLAVSAAAQKGYPDNPAPDFSNCPRKLRAIYADMHDGDKKEITISGTHITIKPSGNNQTWEVQSVMDSESCSASINFSVPGKPNPPPVPLQAALWYSGCWLCSPKDKKQTVFEFTDPSGKLASKDFPLNHWVEDVPQVISLPCPYVLQRVYADIHDGDKKEVIIRGTSLTIKPSGNNQAWEVKSQLDEATCSASIDFNVPGKPGPPKVNLQATVVFMESATFPSLKKTELAFTDPSGTLAPPTEPLNHWVEIGRAMSGSDIAV